MLTNAHKVPGGVEVSTLFRPDDVPAIEAGIQNDWTDAHDAMQMALLTRDKLIQELAGENVDLKKELGETRAVLKVLKFSIRRHLGIDVF